ncbi:MAG: thiamine phosphate synthase, partial [Flavobacteriales bacterium]
MSISKLHVITDDKASHSHPEQVRKVCKGGADWVQLRCKEVNNYNSLKSITIRALELVRSYGAKLMIDDHVHLCKELIDEGYKPDGVHVGKKDMSVHTARKILGNSSIIGGTANTFDDIEALSKDEVDYIGLGPFRFTTTKKKLSPVLGFKGYKQIISQCVQHNIKIPVIAIGGIRLNDIDQLFQTGIHGI